MNEQKPMAAAYSEDGAIDIHSIFATIQGEGPFCGARALFIRLHGCNLRCPGCDTEYTATKQTVTPANLVLCATQTYAWPTGSIIVITGGEPFRQNVVPSIHALVLAGYKVQIETNGVICPPHFDLLDLHIAAQRVNIVCSPKTSRIDATIAKKAIAFKYVLRAGEIGGDGLPTKALGHPAEPFVARPPRSDTRVYVQPMDEQDAALNNTNTEAAIQSCMQYGHLLQLQTHKILGLD